MRFATTDLFELVFEGLDEAGAVLLCQRTIGRTLNSPTQDSGVSEIEISDLALPGGLILHRVHLRLLRYEGVVFDVELNFALDTIPTDRLAQFPEALHKFAMDLATVAGVENFYAGLEPAADEETRIFTGTEKGPYP